MNIGIIGGGPAGLFFAYLMKRHDAGHRIRIVERDPAAATYGWGVVFTDIALAFVREITPELYAAMTRNQEVHDAMRIVHRGQAITLAGNTFHRSRGSMRTLRALLALGIAIEFRPQSRRHRRIDDCDLIVADGAGRDPHATASTSSPRSTCS
jgi:2-polyprenyl-6-methoxyphenol hydroxylase-like FAD-dependent oxidoreductase